MVRLVLNNCAVAPLTIFTNSLKVTKVIGDSPENHKLYLLKGAYFLKTEKPLESEMVTQHQLFQAHQAFFTITCVGERTGAIIFNNGEAQLARGLISRVQTVTMLTDGSNFDRNTGFQVGPVKNVDTLICELPSGDSLMIAPHQEKVPVLY